MDDFLKSSGLILIAVILCIALSSYGKNFVILLSITVCVFVLSASFSYLKPVLAFWEKLQDQSNWDAQWLSVLMKAVGLGVISEIICMICNDSGNGVLGKALQYMTCFVILWMAMPLFTSLLDMINEILNVL